MEISKLIEIIDKNNSEHEAIVRERIDIWTNYVLFSTLWWLGIALTIIPWACWFYYRKKGSSDRLLYAGLSVIVISLVFDVIGEQMGLWSYRFNVIPTLPTYFPWDLTLMPVTIMTLIQFKPSVSPYFKAIFFACLSAYIAEPVFKWLMVYVPEKWSFSYSVPIQFLIYLMADKIANKKNPKIDQIRY